MGSKRPLEEGLGDELRESPETRRKHELQKMANDVYGVGSGSIVACTGYRAHGRLMVCPEKISAFAVLLSNQSKCYKCQGNGHVDWNAFVASKKLQYERKAKFWGLVQEYAFPPSYPGL